MTRIFVSRPRHSAGGDSGQQPVPVEKRVARMEVRRSPAGLLDLMSSQTRRSERAIVRALKQHDTEAVKTLLSGPTPVDPDADYKSAKRGKQKLVHQAAGPGVPGECMQALLDAGANPNAMSGREVQHQHSAPDESNGLRPLHEAVINANLPALRALLADRRLLVDAPNAAGKLPIELAQELVGERGNGSRVPTNPATLATRRTILNELKDARRRRLEAEQVQAEQERTRTAARLLMEDTINPPPAYDPGPSSS